MRKFTHILLFAAIFAFTPKLFAQVSSYSFAESAGTYSVLGGTNSTATGDDGTQNGIAIGFNFNFGGTVYTHFCISTNGFIRLGNAATTIATGHWTNGISITSTHRPLIAAIWDDNHRNTGAISYSTTGSSPNQVLTVDWNNVNIGGGGATSATNLASYQIKIYETTNIVEIIYGGTLAAAGTLSLSAGLNDNTSFLSVTPGAPGTASSGTANNAISATTDMAAKKYTFTPSANCTGAPASVTATGPVATLCPGAAVALSAAPSPAAPNYTYQWQSSPVGAGSWTNVGGATSASYNTTASGSLDYQCLVTCPAGGSAVASNTVTVNVTSPAAAALPYTQGFETWATNACSGTTSIPANEWASSPNTGNNSWRRNDQGSSASWSFLGDDPAPFDAPLSTEGVSSARFHSYGASAGLTGTLDLYLNCSVGGGSLQLSFDYRNPTGTDILQVFLSTNGGASFTQLGSNLGTSSAWSTRNFLFTSSSANTILRFRATSDFGNDDIGMDNLIVGPPPSCLTPAGLSVTAITAPNATFSWSAVTGATGYEYAFTTTPAPPASGTATTLTSVTLNPLAINTKYYAHVRTNCGGTFSSWSTIEFNTTPNDECTGAITLTVQPSGPTCAATVTAVTTAATQSAQAAPTCASFGYEDDIWYTFTATSSAQILNVSGFTQTGGTATSLGFAVYSGTCGSLTSVSCTDPMTLTAGAGTATINGLTAGNTYLIRMWASGVSTNSASWNMCIQSPAPPPANDECSGAITVTTQPFAASCTGVTSASTSGATLSANTSACWSSSTDDDIWYRFTATSTGVVLNVSNFTVLSGTSTQLGYVIYNDSSDCSKVNTAHELTGSCPTVTIAAGAGISTFGSGLVIGNVYTLRLFAVGSPNAASFDFCLMDPPPPPPCVTNIAPAAGATGVLIPGGVTNLSWNASPGAASYNLFFGTTNPPTASIGNTTATNTNVTGLSYNTTYYWYVQPVGPTGVVNTTCAANTTSFTTENPTNCVPLYTSGCGLADSLTYFSLKGEPGGVIYNNSGGVCTPAPSLAYSDFTGSFTAPVLVRGNAYTGFMRTGDPNDYATIWIDFDDDGFFENNERLMNNLRIGTTPVLYSLFVPVTAPAGTHRMRVRVVYYSSAPTLPTDACSAYTYGETEDYNVTISAGPVASRNVSTGNPGACITAASMVVDSLSNMSQQTFIPVLDSNNNFVAQLYPNGNNLGRINTSLYVHNGPLRQDPKGLYYMNRNITITPERQPVTTYNLRMFYLVSELNALIAQPGSGVTSRFDLKASRLRMDSCARGIGPGVWNGETIFPTGFGDLLPSADQFVELTNVSNFSAFFLTGSSVPLPAAITFAGEKAGSRNILRWTTKTESNVKGFSVERSADGRSFVSIGYVNSQAPNGNSTSDLNYIFNDDNPQGTATYYRLRIEDRNGSSKLSNVVLLRRGKVNQLELSGLFPNPASTSLNVVLDVPARDRVTLVVTDLAGRTLIQKAVNVETGTNTIDMDVSGLTKGTYMVRVICSNDCKSVTGRFVKN
jgi:GEVED domain/Secretion system C-terminal sorting domain